MLALREQIAAMDEALAARNKRTTALSENWAARRLVAFAMACNSILVTGGAGYIGSHTVRQLIEPASASWSSTTSRPAIAAPCSARRWSSAIPATASSSARVLDEHCVDTVLHFAAHTIVPESVSDPLKYYRNNTCATRNLLEQCAAPGVARSSSRRPPRCTAFRPSGRRARTRPPSPINPYGWSKLMSEWMLRDLAAASSTLRYVALRYFNVAGSDPGGRIGHTAPKATLLVKVACQVAAGVRPTLSIFGTDYPTPDGTGVRDYIHVEDLAAAHLSALDYLEQGGDVDDAQLRLRPRLQRARGDPDGGARERRQARCPSSRVRAARAIRRRWSPTRSASARCSAGRRGSTTSRPSSATSWTGSSRLQREPDLTRN